MKQISWSRLAQADVAQIHAYYQAIRPEHAVRVAEAAVAAGRLIAANPKSGPVIEKTSHRKWRLANTRYILIYRQMDEEIRIVRVVHGAQNWRDFL